MRLSNFIAFLRSEMDGTCWDDVTYRAHNLDATTGKRTVVSAYRALGFSSIQEVRCAMVRIGYLGPLQGPLARWHVWERLRNGDISKWPLRKKGAGSARPPAL